VSTTIGWGGVWRMFGWTERGRVLGEPGRRKHRSGLCGERGAQQVPEAENAGAFPTSSSIARGESAVSESSIVRK
jgi:hypothetical protein